MEPKYSAPAVEKMLTIIELLSENTDGFSINELARLTNASVNSVYRICIEMERKNYLIKDPVSGYYCLGSAFYYIGKAAEKRMDIRNNALEIMRKLKDLTGETVHITVLRDDRMILLEQVETDNPIQIHVNVGASLYPHASAFGKCLLAYANQPFISEYAKNHLVALTQHTLTEEKRLTAELLQIRSEGVAYDNEEYMDGVLCCGSPIFGSDGKCVAAIGIIAPKYRIGQDTLAVFSDYVKAAANEVSKRMGGLANDRQSI